MNKPQLLDLSIKTVDQYVLDLKALHKIDAYSELLEDLFLIRNPKYKFDKNYKKELEIFIDEYTNGNDISNSGNWFYFPWSSSIVHYLPSDDHFELRTARNRNLITLENQSKISNIRVGIAGMSVGSHCALTLSMMGMSNSIKIADPDTLSGSNMNRVRYDFTLVGQKKTLVALKSIYQMNPYANVMEYPAGVTEDNIDDFFSNIDILIEETDHLETKILLREKARELRIPVIMATDNGDGIILDIERYDEDPKLKLFNGLIGDITLEQFRTFPPSDLPKLATKIAGVDVVVTDMLLSLAEVGKTLYSWPQLGNAATLCGVAVAYAVKKIAIGAPLKSGKISISLDQLLDPTWMEDGEVTKRQNIRDRFKAIMGL